MRVLYLSACLAALIAAPQLMSAQPTDKATPIIKTVTPEVAQSRCYGPELGALECRTCWSCLRGNEVATSGEHSIAALMLPA